LIRQFFSDMPLIAAIMCGILVTWAVAGFGYSMFHPPRCGSSLKVARLRVAETASGITLYQLDNGRSTCPTGDQVVEQHYVARGALTDPWGTSMTVHCSCAGYLVVVRSAGPDRQFNTADDITND